MVFNHSQTELFSQFCLVLPFIFSQEKILPQHTLQGRKVPIRRLAACSIPSWPGAGETLGVGHSSVCPNLMGSHFSLRSCFLPKALAAPGRSRGFTDSRLKWLSITPCPRPACLWQLKDKLVGAELALILAKSSAGILPTTLAVFCPGAGCIQSSFVRNIILKGALGSFKIKDVFSEYKTFIT